MRLYVPEFLAQEKAVVSFAKEQANHIKVRRLVVGDSLVVFNEANGEWQATLINDKQAVLTKLLRHTEALADIALIQPLIAKDRFHFVTEKSVELGVTEFYPLTTHYTQGSNYNAERTGQHIIEAAQQCERICLPRLHSLQSLSQLLRNWDSSRLIYVAIERQDAPYMAAAFDKGHKAALLVGPEGGFTDAEKELLLSQSFVRPTSLGPRILRSETAALTMLAVWQSLCGDLV
jgi:16S rRNA (uracil1498-N3)-methyltransferase